MMKKLLLVGTVTAVALSLGAAKAQATDMYRIYNPKSGEHLYTADLKEVNHLTDAAGWNYEGLGWVAPDKSNQPVYRLYNPNMGDHHYTTNKDEETALVKKGWKAEGIGWYSAESTTKYPVYRQYNPNAKTGAHNFTLSAGEQDQLVKTGWKAEGVSWYAQSPTWLNPTISVDTKIMTVKVGKSFFFSGSFTGADRPTILEGLSSDSSVLSAADEGDYQARGFFGFGAGIESPVRFESQSFVARKVGIATVTFTAPKTGQTTKVQINIIP